MPSPFMKRRAVQNACRLPTTESIESVLCEHSEFGQYFKGIRSVKGPINDPTNFRALFKQGTPKETIERAVQHLKGLHGNSVAGYGDKVIYFAKPLALRAGPVAPGFIRRSGRKPQLNPLLRRLLRPPLR